MIDIKEGDLIKVTSPTARRAIEADYNYAPKEGEEWIFTVDKYFEDTDELIISNTDAGVDNCFIKYSQCKKAAPKNSVKEDLDLVPQDDFDDEKAEALTTYLEDADEAAIIVRKYPYSSSGWDSNVYENLADNAEWLICTEDEAEEYVRDRIQSLIDDVGPLEVYSWNTVEDYLDEDYFNDRMEEDIRYWVEELSYDELAERLEDADIIGEDDKIQDPDWEADEDEPEAEPDMIYLEDLLDSKREELIEYERDSYYNGVEYFENVFGRDYIEEMVKDDPDLVDTERMAEDMARDADWAEELSVDGDSIELELHNADGSFKEWVYAYKIS